ncbi:MAG TPA: pyrimidine 5'-nucleotidase [Geopsychrobacteraceae bacterium]|nr:pyrimidine 5'-nucleotidase [Geopsychrobacteraceae bacterium]
MDAILFDLDNTLYPADKNLFSLIDVRINRYMEEIVAIHPDEVDGLRRQYWSQYGTTLQGLIHHHVIDPEDYLDYVHAIEIDQLLSHDTALQETLRQLDIPCFVFTNGSSGHARNVVKALGIEDLFAGIFDIRVADYVPKPNLAPYQKVLQTLGVSGNRCVMVEDSCDNLRTAKHLGMKTVLIGPEQSHSFIDAHLVRSADITPVLDAWIAESRRP